jgi:RNA 3'-terminal phosphate cyclase (ATP)
MIQIDGSAGEGGGQILRTALGLSLVSGRPFHIRNIRQNRKKPGLMRQHLTSVLAATEVGSAVVEGNTIGSTELLFSPGKIRSGNFHFAIGTAGSCTLVLQTILPALLAANGPSTVLLEGGTHNPMAPPFDFLQTSFLPQLAKMGAAVTAELARPGFVPTGGGRITVSVKPAEKLLPLQLTHRSHSHISARAVCAQLPSHIAERELGVVKEILGLEDQYLESVLLEKHGPGNVISIFAHAAELVETFTGFGQKHLRAEKVALQAVRETEEYLATGAPVGKYLADQLLIPMALAGSGCFLTGRPTNHTLTNIETIQLFLDITFQLNRLGEEVWEIWL